MLRGKEGSGRIAVRNRVIKRQGFMESGARFMYSRQMDAAARKQIL